MKQSASVVIMKDAPTMPRKEEFVVGTVQRSKYAAQKDAPIKSRKEEFAIGTGQRKNHKSLVMKDAPTMSRKEEFVKGTGQHGLEHLQSSRMHRILLSAWRDSGG